MAENYVAIVLPPRESFGSDAAGAIALIVRRLAAAPSRFTPVVIGRPVAKPFTDAVFSPAYPPWWPGPQTLRYAWAVANIIHRLRPALVEVHNRPDLAGRLARLGPPVTLLLNNDPQAMRSTRTLGQRARLDARLAAVAASSAWLARQWGVQGARIVPNCLDLATLPPRAADRENTILFVGRIVSDKGADAFVAACGAALPRLPGWHAKMIGADRFGADSPDTAFLRSLRPAAAAAGVTMAGWQPHDEVLQAMAQAAIVVVPSRWPEPFGMTALEAMACGAALAYAPRGGLPEVAGGAGVAIDPDHPAALADALVALARDPVRRAALSEAGRRRAALFDAPVIAGHLDAVRADILERMAGP